MFYLCFRCKQVREIEMIKALYNNNNNNNNNNDDDGDDDDDDNVRITNLRIIQTFLLP